MSRRRRASCVRAGCTPRELRALARRLGVTPLSGDAGRRWVQGRLDSRAWWAFIAVDLAGGLRVARMLEAYGLDRGDAVAFTTLVLPLPGGRAGVLPIAFARKAALRPSQVSEWLPEAPGLDGSQDILLIGGTPAQALAAGALFSGWLHEGWF